jgi:transcriptional regulator with XRE-family HTH domain
MTSGMFAGLGSTLRLLREQAGLSQGELARNAGMGKSQISKYESGKEFPRLESLERLLDALGVEPLTFFYTAHLLKHRTEISPAAILVTTTPLLNDPALESFRSLFGHFLDSFEILIASRTLEPPQRNDPRRISVDRETPR